MSLTQLNYQDLFHPLAFAIIDQTTFNWSQEIRYINTASLFGFRNLFTAGFQYFGTRQNDAQQQNLGDAVAGPLIKNQYANSFNYGWYAEEVFNVTTAVSLVLGGRLQYSVREIRDRLFNDPFTDVDGNDSGNVSYFGGMPKVGVIWQVTPSVQVYGNASRAFQPPLLLELTAPGQIPGTALAPRSRIPARDMRSICQEWRWPRPATPARSSPGPGRRGTSIISTSRASATARRIRAA